MYYSISIKETPIDEAVLAGQTSKEFGETLSKDYFEKRYKGKDPLIIAAFINGAPKPVGYLIGYDRFNDGSFYCWLSGVWSTNRKRRVFHALMLFAQRWAHKKGYISVKIKTRNKRRNIMHYLVDSDYYILEITPNVDPAENRILMEKKI